LARKEKILELGLKFKNLYDRYDSGSVRYADKYLINKEWLKSFKEYVLYKNLKSYKYDRVEYLTKLTIAHMDEKHPGPISN
jgi:hypothetical protein